MVYIAATVLPHRTICGEKKLVKSFSSVVGRGIVMFLKLEGLTMSKRALSIQLNFGLFLTTWDVSI